MFDLFNVKKYHYNIDDIAEHMDLEPLSDETINNQVEMLKFWSNNHHVFRERLYCSRDDLTVWQLKKLQRLIDWAYDTSPIYRERFNKVGFKKGDIQSIDDLAFLPTLSKDDVIENFPNGIPSSQFDLEKCRWMSTSGSSGKQVQIVLPQNRANLDIMFKYRMFEFAGDFKLDPSRWVYNIHYCLWWHTSLLGNYPVFSVKQDCPEKSVLEHIKLLRPQVVSSIGSYLQLLCEVGENLHNYGVKLINTNSETTTANERAQWEEVFGVPVRDEYSSEELDILAMQCHANRYHLVEDDVFVEVINADASGMGEVIGTDLWNYAMPMIRYEQGDLAILDSDSSYPCPCGSHFRSLSDLSGRSDQAFVNKHGAKIIPGSLLDAVEEFVCSEEAQIRDFRVIQENFNKINILYVPKCNEQDIGRKAIFDGLNNKLNTLFDHEVDLVINRVSEIPPEKSYKRRTLINKIGDLPSLKTVLVISSIVDTPDIIAKYVSDACLPDIQYIYLIEYFNQQVPSNLPENIIPIRDFSDQDTLQNETALFLKDFNIDKIISVDEFAVYVAGILRENLGIDGMSCEQSRLFRDKLLMRKQLDKTAIRVPRVYVEEDILSGAVHYPVVAKPRSLAGAVGVKYIENREQAMSYFLPAATANNYYRDMCKDQIFLEEYIDGDLYHIDCVVTEKQVEFIALSKYIGSPLNFLSGKPLASVVINRIDGVWHGFVQGCINELDPDDGVYHIEAFRKNDQQPVFLEIGYRFGGALVPETTQGVFGVDLILTHIRLQLGIKPVQSSTIEDVDIVSGGWLVFPKDHTTNDRLVVQKITMPVDDGQSTLSTFTLPDIGQDAAGEYFCHKDCLGSFVFIGDKDKVMNDIDHYINNYQVDTSQLTVCKKANQVITVQEINKSYIKKNNEVFDALNDICFTMHHGECVGFLGPNGAGKSTLIKIMSGIQTPDSGSINILGYDPSKKQKQFYKKIGVVFGHKHSLWWDLPLHHSFEFQRVLYDISDEVFKKNYGELVETLALFKVLNQPVRSLSLGERVKSELAMSLLYEPQVLMLDEPTLGLDMASKKGIRQLLTRRKKEQGLSIFMTSHDVGDIDQCCDRVMLIHSGIIQFDGGLDELKSPCSAEPDASFSLEEILIKQFQSYDKERE